MGRDNVTQEVGKESVGLPFGKQNTLPQPNLQLDWAIALNQKAIALARFIPSQKIGFTQGRR